MNQIKISCNAALEIPLSELHEIQGNLKEMSKDSFLKLKNSILKHGIDFAFHVWKDKDGKQYIVDGHGRRKCLIELQKEGYQIPFVPCVETHADSLKEAREKVLRSSSSYHRLTSQGLYEFMNQDGISFDELNDYPLSDFNHKKFEEEFTDKAPVEGEDDVPDVGEGETRVKLGELWQLGEHRLMCGDCTVKENVETLMGGQRAVLWSSDPPYGINHVDTSQEKGQSGGYSKIQNDDLQFDELKDFLEKVIRSCVDVGLSDNFAFYMWHAMKMQSYAAAAAAAAAGILFHRQIIWVKPSLVFGRGQYHWRHELCLMGWLQGKECQFYGERNQTTVWELGRENDKIHPTQKPVALTEIPIKNHTRPGEGVIDPFLGSGSTLIACEKTNRKCYGMEIDPHYCDVILKRWEQFTGKQAVKIN